MSDVTHQGDWRLRLAQAIAAKNTSKRKVSLDAGLGAGAVHSWLAEGKDPSVTHLMRVCAVLGVTLTWLTKGYDITPEAEEILSEIQDNPAAMDGILTLLRSRAAK